MSMKKNVKKSSGGKGSQEVGAPTTYSYGKGSKRANLTPTSATDKK